MARLPPLLLVQSFRETTAASAKPGWYPLSRRSSWGSALSRSNSLRQSRWSIPI